MQRAVFIMFIAMSMIPAGDAAGKLLTSTHGAAPIYVAASRFLIGMLALLPFTKAGTLTLLRDWRVWFRAALLTGGISCIQTALQSTPIATVFAAFFIGPMISYILAAVFLREPVTVARSVLIIIGFGGVLLVAQPGDDSGTGVFWAIAAGCFYGAFLTASRWLSHIATPLALTFTQLLISAILLAPLGLMNVPELSGEVAGLTIASGLFSMGGNLLLLYAYGLVAATRLAPLVYFQLIAAVALGWVIFNDWPDPLTWLGMAIILGSGLISTRVR